MKIPCPIENCDIKKSKHLLRQHLRYDHPGSSSFKCKIESCSFISSSIGGYDKHLIRWHRSWFEEDKNQHCVKVSEENPFNFKTTKNEFFPLISQRAEEKLNHSKYSALTTHLTTGVGVGGTSSTLQPDESKDLTSSTTETPVCSESFVVGSSKETTCTKPHSLTWLLTYELPEFPLLVLNELEEARKEGKAVLSKTRKQIGRILYNSISSKTIYASTLEYQSVCLALVKKYPCLADKDAKNPVGTWVISLRQRCKDKRRNTMGNPEIDAMRVKYGFTKRLKPKEIENEEVVPQAKRKKATFNKWCCET